MRVETVTVVTPAWVKQRGADVPDWAHATSATYLANVQPLDAQEVTTGGRQGVKSRLRLSGPQGMVLTAHDRVTRAGLTYEVESVSAWGSPTGALAHTEAVLWRMEG